MSLRRALSHSPMRAISGCLATSRFASPPAESSGQWHLLQARRHAPSLSTPEDFDIMGKGASQVVDTYTRDGFVIGGVEYQGNVFLYQELSLLWRVKSAGDITPDSLRTARAVKPQPDLLIIGCGDKIEELPKATKEAFRNSETMLEVLDTPNAIATYNILVQEGRQVAAAMILPSS